MAYRFLIAALLALLTPLAALGQNVQQSGSTITPSHVPYWVSNGVIGDSGTASDSRINSFGVTSNSSAGFCVASGRASAAGRQLLCMGAPLASAAVISLQNYGTATAQDLKFVINGTDVVIPTGGTNFVQSTGTLVSGHMPCWSGTSGLVVDCGVGAGAGTANGMAYYSAAGTIGGTAALSNGQMVVGVTGSAPTPRTLSGDVSSVSSAGAVTLGSVNGVAHSSSYTAHGVLLGEGTSAFTSTVSSNTGYCLLSQGLSSDPIWAACASGAGSAGGADTQVQYNAATSLQGSANLTWVSPALKIGVAGTTTGQLQLAPIAGASGTITIQNPNATSAYNWNLPTGAGSSGQPLLSGGGGSNSHTYGTLSVSFGGTGNTSASGTTLDAISGFSSTGYINRTGSGTYSFSTVIPVSGGGTNLASGTSGGILGYTASGTLASSVLLTQYGLLVGGGAGATPTAIIPGSSAQILLAQTSANPSWNTMSGDATISSSGALTVANSAITVAKQANAAAYTLEGNFTGSSAAPQFSTIGALTQKASPGTNDLLLIQDQAASGALKYATVSSVSAAGSVSSIAGNTGAFTLANGIDNSTNQIQLTAARRTLPTTQTFLTGSGTYTTPANALWIEIEAAGGGGGGQGSGTSGGSGANGGNTCWNTSGAACTSPVYQAGGGTGSIGNSAAGGAVTGSATPYQALGGGSGTGRRDVAAEAAATPGSPGGASCLGGGGGGGRGGEAGQAGGTNTGGGGGGGGANTVGVPGGGGGSGACLKAIIGSPAATYTYSVGASGTAGTAGTSGQAGGAGAVGGIWVIEHYGS